VVVVVEYLLEFFDGRYRDDFVRFQRFWWFFGLGFAFGVVRVCFGQGEGICNGLEMHDGQF
jgi:hypothetical protein